jgi:ferritin-like metal-binding protein YciE
LSPRTWAKTGGLKEAAPLLEQTLQEEKKADGLLNQIANGEVNRKAAAAA